MLGRVFEQDGTTLAVGDEMPAHRRIRRPEFLGDDVALTMASLLSTVVVRPGHADPALGADAAAELGIVQVALPGLGRVEGAGRHLLGDKGPHLLPQRLALRRETDLIETEGCGHGLARFRVGGRLSARGDKGPELLSAARGHAAAERRRPMTFIAEIITPC